jgi:hypothetical protein
MMRDMDEKGEGELYAYARMGEGPPVGWRMSVKEARRPPTASAAARSLGSTGLRFPLYGLPLSWAGERFLGGASWGSLSGKETIHSLSLVHGAIVEGEGPTLVVETAEPTAPEGGGTLRILAEQLWRGEAKSVHDALANFRRRSGDTTMLVSVRLTCAQRRSYRSRDDPPCSTSSPSLTIAWAGRRLAAGGSQSKATSSASKGGAR